MSLDDIIKDGTKLKLLKKHLGQPKGTIFTVKNSKLYKKGVKNNSWYALNSELGDIYDIIDEPKSFLEKEIEELETMGYRNINDTHDLDEPEQDTFIETPNIVAHEWVGRPIDANGVITTAGIYEVTARWLTNGEQVTAIMDEENENF